MLPIKDLNGDTHLATNIKTVIRNKKVNGEKTLQFISIPDVNNIEAFDAVNNESTIIFKNDPFIIKKLNEKSVGETSIKQVGATHTFFNVMINCHQYDSHTGSQTFFAALTRVFGNTPFEFVIVDSFLAETFENFGRDNCLALFQNVLERYGAEFEVIGNTVYLRKQIGAQTDFQLRWKSNIKSIDKEVNTEGLSTVIRGYGGKPDDNGVYPIQEEYHSPNESIFGTLIADTVYNENITTVAGMQAHLIKVLVDEPQLSITVDIAEIKGDVKNEGDSGFIIYEPMQVKLGARVVEITETFEYVNGEWIVLKTSVTLSNLRNKLTDVTTRFAQTSKRVDNLFAGNEKLPYNVLPEAVRIAAEAINNSLTEIQYPVGQGIILQDPDNPLIMVRLTSKGIGLSDDGGATYRTAMTGFGIVTNELVAGVIRTNNIQIVGEDDLFYWNGEGLFAYNSSDLTKFVRLNSDGMYIAKGALTMERSDGYVIINNGLLQNEFTIQGTSPAFTSGNVNTVNRYYNTTLDSPQECDAFFYKHAARYLKIKVVLYAEGSGTGSRISIKEIGGGGNTLAQTTTYNTNQTTATENPITLTIDLGVPNGSQRGFYLMLNTNVGGRGYGRLLKAWLEG